MENQKTENQNVKPEIRNRINELKQALDFFEKKIPENQLQHMTRNISISAIKDQLRYITEYLPKY